MISKMGTFKDPLIESQINEIVNNQFAKGKEATVTFTAAGVVTKADVGFHATRYVVIDRNANINIWRDSSDSRYTYLKASGAGKATLKFFKGE